jgi:(p)ppGpp synthase/HD superfamily hydrolase
VTTVPRELTEAGRKYSKADAQLIERAYVCAAYWHRDQTRKSGDPYISHPVAVATMLAGLGMDAPTVCAALLHDVVDEDRPPACPLDVLRDEFGGEIAGLVEAFTRLDDLASAISTHRRALIIKLVDRLHNMQTLRHLPKAKQRRKSRETLEVFAPVASDLGLSSVESQLERLALATLYPKRFTLRVSRRVLEAGAVLLPAAARARWLQEWLAELHVLPKRRDRLRFTLQVLGGMSRLAYVLRRPFRP